MMWLAWRQFRAQAAVAIAALAGVVAVLIVTGPKLRDLPDPAAHYQELRLLGTVLIGVPAAIGAFWGAPLVTRELEAGTHRVAWTQSITRTRWLADKLVVVGGTSVIVTAIFSALFTWWSGPVDRAGNRIGSANFAPTRHRSDRLRGVRRCPWGRDRHGHAPHAALRWRRPCSRSSSCGSASSGGCART